MPRRLTNGGMSRDWSPRSLETTAPKDPRFVLFDTSQFTVPTFARIARQPDLSEMSGTGFPYNRSQHPVALIIERGQSGALSAAATLLGRMSVAAGRTIPVEPLSPGRRLG